MLDNIPSELKALAQWVVADMRPDPETGLPCKIPYNPRTGRQANVMDATTWGTYEEALSRGGPVGFVLSASDPYCIIDLDRKAHNPPSPEQLARQDKILAAFNSYTERSVSGEGYHIIVKGSIPAGVHRDHVEMYSSGRYMICTGNVVRPAPVSSEYQGLLEILYGEMLPPPSAILVDRAAVMDDTALFEMASHAVNGDKFNALCRGEWQNEYPSQSEADFALLSIIAFYTADNSQVRRVFRMSALGKRGKATKNDDYLNRALGKIRAQQPPPLDTEQLRLNAELLFKPAGGQEQSSGDGNRSSEPERRPGSVSYLPGAEPRAINGITLPPGIIGELAVYFYNTAIRPVPEVAIAAAIATVSGIVGRSYNISGSGLNQYLILLAKTGSGKEGALAGIENLIAAVRPQIPMADQFLGPAAFASGQALVRVLNDRPCFVSVLGEFGLTLQQLSDHNANSAQVMLRKVLLDLYAKSGWNRSLRSSVYSDTEKNTKIIQAPNVTILGESTPETFYDGLDASHIAEGLIPRFTVIEYHGDRPARNRNANIPPSRDLAQRFSDLIAVALTTTNNHSCIQVQTDEHALALLDAFDTEVDAIMNASKQEVEIQLWNRAHLKALKLAALLCVGINPHQPIITAITAQWAIDFIRRDVEGVAARFTAGDVGQGDRKQMHDAQHVIELYYQTPPPAVLADPRLAAMHKDGIIPYNFILPRLSSVASFRKDRMGATSAIKKTVQALVEMGALIPIPPIAITAKYQFSGVSYGMGVVWKNRS